MTQEEVKSILDKHIVKYQRYYSTICISYFNGRYLWEDMFQELYLQFLKVRPETFEKFHNTDRLHFLGGKIISFLYSKRGQRKNHSDSQTSVFNETCGIIDISEYRPLIELSDEGDAVVDRRRGVTEIAEQPSDPLQKVDIAIVKRVVEDLYTYDPFLYDVFTFLQKESINSLSKRSGINRKYLTDSHKIACEFIRNHKQLVNF